MPTWPVPWEAAVPALPHPRHPLAHTAEHGAGGRAPAGVGAPPGRACPQGSPVSAPAAVHAPGDRTWCAAQHAPSQALDHSPALVFMLDPSKGGCLLIMSCVRACLGGWETTGRQPGLHGGVRLCMLMQRREMTRVMLRMLSRMRMLSMLRSAAASLWPTGDRCALCSIMHSIDSPKYLRSTHDAVKGKHSCV